MTKPPNPITQGLRSVARDPVIYLVEILWRWCFIAAASFLVFSVAAFLLNSIRMTEPLLAALRSHDPQKLGGVLILVPIFLGNKLIVALTAVPLGIAAVWTIFSTLGRGITVKRLRSGMTCLGFGSVLAIQAMRAFLTWLCVVLLVAAGFMATRIATRGPKPDLALFYLIAMPSVLLLSIFWVVGNWYLSLAVIFGREAQNFRASLRDARQTVRRQLSDFAGTGFVFLLLRVVVLLVALAICGLASSMAGTSPQAYFALTMVVALAYLAISYFLYMARMAAYLALAAAHVEPGGPKLVTPLSSLPAGNSTSL
jgi:hypothetical protein